ncbi:hypothetical protein V2G26_003646 [Clonostachys chloroleuca]|uniref:Initiation-specific alpha-1,6-mannosyltransferase n=1 Tax=Clonostachys chloroleuca TaxID=1926264 RepID=A0AA35MHI8_9HYPO|nr:unnamed protein product [Clonostachys chloroleuca]
MKAYAMMNSPLGSPTLAASTAKFRNKIPTQVKRSVPLYAAIVFFFLLILNWDLFYSPATIIWNGYAARPTRPGSTFPQKIWQTWKIDPMRFGIRDSVIAHTWLEKNPYLRYEVITDFNDLTWIEEKFGARGLNRPDIIHFYQSVNLPIIKADLLRYMIMYAEGGVYADIDVEAMKPFHRFFPEHFDENDYDMIVGVEVDQPEFRNHPILGSKSESFCQWTIVSRPGQPVMLKLIENIMAWMKKVAREQGVAIGAVELDFDQVISGTGPSAFTRALLDEMNSKRKRGEGKVTWDNFHNMYESKVVGRVLVLTVEAFCAGQGHSDSGNHDSRNSLVKHHYHASNWPSKHRRYLHPAYGQVEDCNWEPTCVATWDKNVKEFDSLPPKEKQAKIDEYNEKVRQEQEEYQRQLLEG